MKAQLDTWCALCPDPIVKGQSIVPHHGAFIHSHCAPGQDDE